LVKTSGDAARLMLMSIPVAILFQGLD